MNIPIVTVVVLTFNSERYIGRSLRSLARQSFVDFEAIVVDAGSTDQTREIVKLFDHRFRWFELPGSDMGAARNYGMKMSQGRYLMFLDSDDFYLSEKIQRQVAVLEAQPDADVAFCSAWHFRTGRPNRVGLKQLSAQPITLQDYLAGRNHNLNTMCMRRRVWEAGFAFGEGERGRYGEEWRLQLAMAQRGVPMTFKMDPLVVAEMRPDSHTVWSLQWTMKMQAIAEVEHVATLLTPEQRSTVDVAAIIDNFRYKLLIALLLDDQESEAVQVAALIRDDILSRQARRVVAMARWIPRQLLGSLLRRLWLWRQNRSFDWQPASAALRDEFAAVQRPIGNRVDFIYLLNTAARQEGCRVDRRI